MKEFLSFGNEDFKCPSVKEQFIQGTQLSVVFSKALNQDKLSWKIAKHIIPMLK